MVSRRMRASWLCLSAAALWMVAVAGAQEDKPDDPGKTEITLKGKKVTITYGRPSTDGNGYKSMQNGVPAGTVWRMGRNNATKIVTEADLKFGDTVVKAGSYSLWAKRSENDSWILLFHPEADVWGFPSPTEGFLHETPLKSGEPESDVKWMEILLKADGDVGTFSLAWGDELGSVTFTTAD